MKDLAKEIIQPKTGVAFKLRQGQLLKVSSPEGGQVSEMLCYNLGDPDEWLSSGRTLGHSRAWLITKGHTLYSNRSNPMLTIVEDTCGRHDFFLAPCNQGMFAIHDDHPGSHDSCHENLYKSLMGWDIDPDEIHTTFSIFMNVKLNPDGSIFIDPPQNKAGDYVLFRAEMDLVVGLTACAAHQYNGGKLKSIQYEILEQQ